MADTLAARASGVGTVAADALGAAVTGVAAHGAVATGVDARGVDATGAVAIGVAAIGTTGIMTMISSSLVASDFRGGVGVIHMDIMEATPMVMVTGLATVMEVTRTVTGMGLATGMAMATAMEATNMVTVTDMEMDTATGAAPELPSYSAGSLALVIITDP